MTVPAFSFLSLYAIAFSGATLPLEVSEERCLRAQADGRGSLRITVGEPSVNHSYGWVTLKAKEGAVLDLSSGAAVSAPITNMSAVPVETMLWVCGSSGWSAVGDFATLKAGETRVFSAELRETYPDGTPKVDPGTIDRVEVMVRGVGDDLDLAVGLLRLEGEPGGFTEERQRLTLPSLSESGPAPGERVKVHSAGADSEGPYAILYLPPSWKPEESYPVIVEYPGNIFLNAKCYSTGRPEQCVIGYGMSEGKGSIVLSLPFVDSEIPDVVESGFGNPDETLDFAKAMIEAVLEDFGGDRENMVLTGFSRGSIACGFIGLRDDEIGSYWKGIHGCQHYDGSAWRESTMEDAIERAKRFKGRAIFQTDNDAAKYAPVVEATDPAVDWTWVASGLGFHSTAMFLDDRPSTLQLREWYRSLIASP